MTKTAFFHGTIILIGAGLITKIFGFIYRIALSRIIGAEGVGLFQMAFPILLFALVITSGGIPVAISKLISEAIAKKEEKYISKIIKISLMLVFVASVLVTIGIILFAPIISNIFLTDKRAIYCIITMTPLITIISLSSVFRGYFQGKQNMSPYALSTIVEQITRIFSVLLLSKILLPFGIQYAAAGAMIGMVIGETFGFLYIYLSYRKDSLKLKSFLKNSNVKSSQPNKGITRKIITELLKISTPITLSKAIGSLSYALEPIVVSQALSLAGISVATSTALYGKLEGMAVPLVFFPAFITLALSVSLVPAISEAAVQKKQYLVQHRFQQTIRLSFLLGIPFVIILYILAEPLVILFYNQPTVAKLIKLMTPFALLYYLQGPLASILQGLNKAHLAMKNSIIGAVAKNILILILGAQPFLNIDGVIIAINFGIVVVTTLHFLSILKIVPLTIDLKHILKISLVTTITSIFTLLLSNYIVTSLIFKITITSFGCIALYLSCLLLFSLVTKDDFRNIPFLKKLF